MMKERAYPISLIGVFTAIMVAILGLFRGDITIDELLALIFN